MFIYIRWGYELRGRTDEVPGVFYVATRFFVVNGLLLCPLQSFLVLDPRHAVPLPTLYTKSLLVAYLRMTAWLAVLACFILLLLASWQEDDGGIWPWPWALSTFVVIVVGALCIQFHSTLRLATYERAAKLCLQVQQPTVRVILQRAVQRHFMVTAEAVVVPGDEEAADDLNDLELAEAMAVEDEPSSDSTTNKTEEEGSLPQAIPIV